MNITTPSLVTIESRFRNAMASALDLLAVCASGLIGIVRRFLTDVDDAASQVYLPSAPSESNGRNAVLVIDVSESMGTTDWKPSRLGAAQAAAMAFILRLTAEEPSAHVAIVAYGSKAHAACPLVPVCETAALTHAIESLQIDGFTNITAGLRKAKALLQQSFSPSQVVLLSDGQNNEGTCPIGVARVLRQCATVETIGIGGTRADVDEDLLKAIASSYPDGSKRYRWIGDEEQLVEHFHNLAGRISRS